MTQSEIPVGGHSTISREELQREIAGGRLILAEVLPPAHYAQGHLPGAINLPLEGLLARVTALVSQRDAALVLYCSGPTCNNSHIAQRKLSELGYRNVRVYAGGKSDWKAAGLALAT